MAGFEGEDGGGALHEAGVCEGEAGGDIDDGANASAGDDIGELKEFLGVGDGKLVFAGGKSGFIKVFENVFGRLNVDNFLLKGKRRVSCVVCGCELM